MKVVILAGGLGTRLAEETQIKPKPMVEIGGKPIIWHIMMHYSHYSFNEFAIALGYKGEFIKKYMLDYRLLNSDLTINFNTGEITRQGGHSPQWNVNLVDTGASTQTGGRMKHLAPYLNNETFMMTYGDGISNVNLQELLTFHRSHKKLVTITVVHPPARFGHLNLDNQQVTEFSEKPQTREGWINGGFFVLEPQVLDYINNDQTSWEHEPLQTLAREGQVMAYQHTGFWQCMDTLRDQRLLENLWQKEEAPWKLWQD